MELPHRKTCKRYDVDAQAHCLTFSCFKQQPFLSRQRTCLWLAEALSAGREQGLYDLWGYVFMPEHVHLVLLPHPSVKISRILYAVKASVAQRALHWVRSERPAFLERMADRQPNGRCQYRFWQRGGGYDRNLRTEHDVREKINYIHANPLRRGLVTDPDDWPWSSYRAWRTGEDVPIPIDRESLLR
jgi:putative transposase